MILLIDIRQRRRIYIFSTAKSLAHIVNENKWLMEYKQGYAQKYFLYKNLVTDILKVVSLKN